MRHRSRWVTSSVLGGKNSKEKKVLPALMDSFILSTTFIIAGARGSYSSYVVNYILYEDLSACLQAPVASSVANAHQTVSIVKVLLPVT